MDSYKTDMSELKEILTEVYVASKKKPSTTLGISEDIYEMLINTSKN